MTAILLAPAAADLESTFAEATGGEYLSVAGPLPATPAEMLQQLGQAPAPDVIVLDARPDPRAALDLAGRFHQELPYVVVVLATDCPEGIALPAMRAGVRDLLPSGADVTEIRQVLSSAVVRHGVTHEAGPARAPGRVITVVSPKGGAGKTTVATNLAAILAQSMPYSTVLVDLDLQFGDVATALALQAQSSVAEAVQGPASRDSIVLKTYLSSYRNGLYVLPAPERPYAGDAITADQVTRLVAMLAIEFPFVVVDTGPGLSEHTLAALDQTTDPVLLTTLSVPGLLGMRKTYDTLAELRMTSGTQRLVVNFADTAAGLSIADVEATLGTTAATLPTSKAALGAMNAGEPLAYSARRDPLVRALGSLAQELLPEGVLVGPGRHRLSRGRTR